MAQTERDQVSVRALLADQATGDISPQDIRDALASAMGYGGMLLSVGGAPAVMNGVGTSFVLMDECDTISAQSSDVNTGGVVVELSPNYRITMTAEGIYRIDFWASFSSSAGNKLVTFRPHVNGAPGLVEVDRDVAQNDTGVAAFSGIIPYSAGDYVDMRVKIDSGTTNLTFLAAGLSCFRVG